jgi:hypothetical protein
MGAATPGSFSVTGVGINEVEFFRLHYSVFSYLFN